MKPRSNLKARQYISLLIWGLCFGLTIAATFAFSGKYYGPVWSLSMLIMFLPHFYWAYMAVKLPIHTGGSFKGISYFKISFLIAIIGLCAMLFRFSLPLQLTSQHAEVALSLGPILFFGSIFFCFFMGAQALVKTERRIFNTSPNRFLAFLIFFYLPIGIFFLVPRLEKLYDSSLNAFD